MKFCDKLQKIRKENNVTQEQLADKLNVSRQAVSKWESGTAYPDTEKLIQISKIFNTSLDELINDNAGSNKNNEMNKKINLMDTLNIFFDFISKSVNMFWSMKFSEKLKVLFEMIVLILVIWAAAAISNSLIAGIVRRIFMFMPQNILIFIVSVVDALVRALWIVLGCIIVVKVFKTRYLDYYIIITDDSVKEKVIEEPIKELKEKRDYKIVIRDPEHSNFNLLKKIGKIFIFFLKILGIFIALPVVMIFIFLMVLFVISLGYTFYGLLFNGISLALLGMLAFTLLAIWFIYNLIFNQKNAYTRMFMVFVISISLIGIGVGLSASSLRNFEIVDEPNDFDKNQIVTISMSDNLIIPDIMNLDESKYVLDDKYEDVKIEAKTVDNFRIGAYIHQFYNEDGDIYNEDGNMYRVASVYATFDGIHSFNNFLDDLKNKRINTYNFNDSDNNYVIDMVYISSDNLTQIKENYKNAFGK